MKSEQIPRLLEHEARSLMAISELIQTSLTVLEFVYEKDNIPELIQPSLKNIIQQCESVITTTKAVSIEASNIASDFRSINEIRKSYKER